MLFSFCSVGSALAESAVTVDSDADGLNDETEIVVYHTDWLNPDTDGDGFSDGDEVEHGYSPRHGDGQHLVDVDSDLDYLNDDWEIKLGTDIMNPDSDGDLFLDGTEVAAAFDPLNPAPVRLEKLIRVSDERLTLTYSFGGRALDTIPVSTGKSGMSTPRGEFSVLAKIPVKHYGGPGFDLPNTKWNLLFTRSSSGLGYYIHGAYWHNLFGQARVSHGCVNVRYEDMERLYWWAQEGTRVVVE
ncbi:MAG: L,D-transpeptidase family protein [bacterium]